MLGRYINLGNPVNRSHPLNAGLVSWWLPLPNNSGGGTLFDIAGTNHGTLSGMATDGSVWQGGPNGFGGTDYPSSNSVGRVILSSSGITFPLTAATLSVFFRTHSDWTSSSFGSLAYCRAGSGNGNSFGMSRMTDGGTPNRLSYYLCDSAGNFWGGSYLSLYSASDIANSTLYHAVLTWDGNSPVARGFLNGVRQFSDTGTARTPSAYAGNFHIGNDPQSSRSGRCTVYSMSLYGCYKSDADVAALYEQHLRGHPDTLRRFSRRAYLFADTGAAAPAGLVWNPMRGPLSPAGSVL